MSNPLTDRLSRRERQIMDIIYRRGEAAVADVRAFVDLAADDVDDGHRSCRCAVDGRAAHPWIIPRT